MDRLKIGISACLLGANVRYDGVCREFPLFTSLERDKLIDWVPVCPETEAGMSVPRSAMRLMGERLMTIETGQDMTEVLTHWCGMKLNKLRDKNICGFIFKSRSPSCGISGVEAATKTGGMTPAMGIFARAFIKEFPLLPIEDDERISLHGEGEKFFKRALLCMGYEETNPYIDRLLQAARQWQPGTG